MSCFLLLSFVVSGRNAIGCWWLWMTQMIGFQWLQVAVDSEFCRVVQNYKRVYSLTRDTMSKSIIKTLGAGRQPGWTADGITLTQSSLMWLCLLTCWLAIVDNYRPADSVHSTAPMRTVYMSGSCQFAFLSRSLLWQTPLTLFNICAHTTDDWWAVRTWAYRTSEWEPDDVW